MILTEQIQLKKDKKIFHLCHLAKNLYNQANYIVRQRFFKERYWTRYQELNESLKKSENYRTLPIQSSQQVLRLLDKNWKAFFKAIKDWKKHPEKYFSMPKPPRYKKKNGELVVIFTNQQVRIKNGYLYFPKKAGLPPIKTRIQSNIHQVRIIPRGNVHVLEIVYEKPAIDLGLDKNRIIGIDLGLNNLVTIVNNNGLEPFIIKGGVVKSINQYYNKKRARLISIKDKQGYKILTKRLHGLTLKRNNKIKDYFHKISRYIVNYCIQNDIGTIIIGYNKNWKQAIQIGKRNNQNFVQVPFYKLVQMLEYKSELVGITVTLIQENHASRCSFLDKEPIQHHEKYLGKRINRRLFRTKSGVLINADVNGGYNMIKKAIPKAFADGIEDVVRHPRPILIEG